MKKLTENQAMALVTDDIVLYHCHKDGTEAMIDRDTAIHMIESIRLIYEDYGEYVGIEESSERLETILGISFDKLPKADYCDESIGLIWQELIKAKLTQMTDGSYSVSNLPAFTVTGTPNTLGELLKELDDYYSTGVAGLLQFNGKIINKLNALIQNDSDVESESWTNESFPQIEKIKAALKSNCKIHTSNDKEYMSEQSDDVWNKDYVIDTVEFYKNLKQHLIWWTVPTTAGINIDIWLIQ